MTEWAGSELVVNSNFLSSDKAAVSIQFTEEMHGYYALEGTVKNFGKLDEEVYEECARIGKAEHQLLKFTLTICVPDIDSFMDDPKLEADATGFVFCPSLGGKLQVESGVFNLFVRPSNSTNFDASKEMHYRLHFQDKKGEPWTFYGYKVVKKENGLNGWSQTTTLYTRLFKGDVKSFPTNLVPWAQGILTLNLHDFIKQLGTMASNGRNFTDRMRATIKFVELFAENLWEAYAPSLFDTNTYRWNEHIFPVNTLEGVKGVEKSLHAFNTPDGLTLNLTRFCKKPSRNVVVLFHGLTTSTDMYIMPEHYNLVQYLLDHGFTDVISVDWRGSNRFSYNLKVHRYTMDDLALYDMPTAIAEVKKLVGEDVALHAIAHCVGAVGLMTSLAAGQTKGLQSVICNSVSLNPKIHWQSKLKLSIAPWVMDHIIGYPYLAPELAYLPGFRILKILAWLEGLIHRECKESACHMISFMWGWGFPAAYQHENLHPLTHRRLKDLYGGTSMNYFRHLKKMIQAKKAIPYTREGEYDVLPESYFENLERVKLPPTLLVSGTQNHIFPGSNNFTYDSIKKHFPSQQVDLLKLEGYGHQDIFMGKNCDQDVFPHLIEFLTKHKG